MRVPSNAELGDQLRRLAGSAPADAPLLRRAADRLTDPVTVGVDAAACREHLARAIETVTVDALVTKGHALTLLDELMEALEASGFVAGDSP